MDARDVATADDAGEKPNAFTELLSQKLKPESPGGTTDAPTKRTLFSGRDGLGVYSADPASFPSSRVLDYDDDFVVIQDLYPKATVHFLILPRDPSKNAERPQEAFDDPVFLAKCRAKEMQVRKMAEQELRRELGRFSKQERKRTEAMNQDNAPAELPPGRDWSLDIMTGTHANPSMNHVHIHVLSRDLVSECMKKTNHYLSFTTDFFIGMDQFPLPHNDHRRKYRHLPKDMVCWRCGEPFQNRITKLREHLLEELEHWKRE